MCVMLFGGPRGLPSFCTGVRRLNLSYFNLFATVHIIIIYIPVFAEHNEVRANRVDARIVNHREKIVSTIEMSYPWVENRGKKDEEKTLKYGPLGWELKAQYKGYKINQYKVIIDVLGGWSVDMERSLRVLLGSLGAEKSSG